MNLFRIVVPLAFTLFVACTTPVKPRLEPQPTPVGTPVGAPVSAVIGMAGGVLTSPDGGVVVQVPAGAFAKDETVSIQEIENHAQGKLGKAFRLSPEGSKFAKPVTLTFALSESQVAGVAPTSLKMAYQTTKGTWSLPKAQSFDAVNRKLSVQTDHFSDWSAIAGIQIVPGSATVKTGQSIHLQIAVCTVEDDPNNPLDGVIGDCSKLSMQGVAKNWSVNSVVGGNSTVGTLAPNSSQGSALYTAPAKRPAQNPVAISVEWTYPEGDKAIAVANLNIEEDSLWTGTMTYTETGSMTIPAKKGHTGSITQEYNQSETFKVSGVVGVNGTSTRLRLEVNSKVMHSIMGETRGEFYASCVANQPPILRELYEYSIQRQLEGSSSDTIEAELNTENGKYELFAGTIGATIKGSEVVVDKLTQFCFDRVLDNSYNSTHEFHVGGSGGGNGGQLKVQGDLSGDGSSLSGSYEETGSQLDIPTKVKVTWNLSRTR